MALVTCPSCGKNVSSSARQCPNCRGALAGPAAVAANYNAGYNTIRTNNYASNGFDIMAFLDFKFMIATSVLRTIYVLGAIAISLGSAYNVYLLFEYSRYSRYSDSIFWNLIGIASAFIIVNLFWRLICESWILFFSIHDNLILAVEELKKSNSQN